MSEYLGRFPRLVFRKCPGIPPRTPAKPNKSDIDSDKPGCAWMRVPHVAAGTNSPRRTFAGSDISQTYVLLVLVCTISHTRALFGQLLGVVQCFEDKPWFVLTYSQIKCRRIPPPYVLTFSFFSSAGSPKPLGSMCGDTTPGYKCLFRVASIGRRLLYSLLSENNYDLQIRAAAMCDRSHFVDALFTPPTGLVYTAKSSTL